MIAVGSKVTLNSGSPEMEVVDVKTIGGRAVLVCQWQDGNVLRLDEFDQDTVTEVVKFREFI